MSDAQKQQLTDELLRYAAVIDCFVHGDCVGADAEAHEIASVLLGPNRIHIRPPSDSTHRAWCAAAIEFPTEPYLKRDHKIVETTQVLIAAPKGPEILRSGTWATVRHARKLGRIILLLERA